MMNFLFGGPVPAPAAPPKSAAEEMKAKVKEWQRGLRREMMHVERGATEGRRSEAKLVAEVKSLIAKGKLDNAKQLTKSVVQMRKHIERQGTTKAMLNSLSLQLGEHAGAWRRRACRRRRRRQLRPGRLFFAPALTLFPSPHALQPSCPSSACWASRARS